MTTDDVSATRRSGEWILLVVLVFIAVAWLYRTPYQASGLDIVPDSVEYALAPLQLLETGRYEILLEGRALPPRYPPWFSTVVIAPAYVLFGHEPGNAILPITLLGVAGVYFAWAIGRRISSGASGVFAGLAVLAIPTYRGWGSQVMSDVPCAALMLGGGLLYLNLVERPPLLRRDLFAGFLVAIAMLFRPVFAAMMLPFLFAFWRQRPGFILRTALFLIPVVAAVAASALYNRAAFGSPWRNGYHFWTPVPSDYPSLTFSLDYVRKNVLVVIAQTALPLLVGVALAAWIILKTTARKVALRPAQRSLLQFLLFVLLTAGPILVFHLFYFFSAERFHLPLLAGIAVIAGSLVGMLVERWTRILNLLWAALLLLAIIYRVRTPEPPPLRRIAADRMRQQTPANAIILSNIEPVYLERMAAAGSSRRIVPLSRRVEYASKILAPKRIDLPNPPPANWHDYRAAGVLGGGAMEAVRFVASEQIEDLVNMAAAGTPIFLDATYVEPSDAAVLTELKKRFDPVTRAPRLFELRPR